MGLRVLARALLAGSALLGAPALSQVPVDRAAEIAALRAQLRAMEARLADLEAPAPIAQPASPPVSTSTPAPAPAPRAAAANTEIRFSGAPRFSQGEWSFKPRGRIQLDAGYVSAPDGVPEAGLGFATRLRRGRLGVEGTVPGGFGYRAEVDVAGGDVTFTDLYLSYEPSDALTFTLGQHDNFQGLERQTSSNFTSFMERAGFTNAFNFERRLGLSAAWAKGPVLVQAGLFADDLDALNAAPRGSGLGTENGSWSVDGRAVYAPEIGEAQLHLGASLHRRQQNGLADASVATRYRHRPALRTTDIRFVDTGNLLVSAETHWGVEAALVRGPFHAAAEGHWLRASLLGAAEPTFFGGYAELGWFLTGESRGYRDGSFNRTRVARPLGQGGMGAVQLNLRYDRLDLTDRPVIGGTQDALLASAIWIPQDHVRFLLNGGWLWYDDAALPAAGGDRSYGSFVLGARAQIDF